MPIRRIREKIVFENRWLRVYDDDIEHPDGQSGTYSWIDRNNGRGGAVVVPRLPDGRILLIKCHRYVLDTWSWEFPGGGAASGETHEQAAVRELQEETGLNPIGTRVLGQFTSDSGFIKIRHSAVLAELTEGAEKSLKLDQQESVDEARFVTEQEAWQMVETGEVFDGVTITALGLLYAEGATPASPSNTTPAGQRPRRVRAKLMYDSPWWRLYEDDVVRHDGKPGHYVRAETSRGSGAILVVPRTPSGRHLLIKTYRYPVDEELWEFPAGLVEAGEDPVETAARELEEEETGLRAKSVHLIGTQFPVAGLISNEFYSLLAEVPEVDESALKLQREEGIVGAKFVTLDDLADMVRANEIRDNVTLGAVARLLAFER